MSTSRTTYVGYLWIVLLAGTLLLLAGCLAENGKEGTAAPPPPPPGTEYSFATDIQPQLQTAGCYDCHGTSDASACSACHADSRTAASTNTSTLAYSDIVGQASTATTSGDDVVTSGSSDTSTLWWVVNGDSRYTSAGGAMATLMGVSGMSSTVKTMIKDWIDQGAKP